MRGALQPAFVDCSEAMLGQLSGFALPYDGEPQTSWHGRDMQSNCINGVELPENVLRELRLLGRPLMSYSRGELHDAKLACAMDATLIDDPDGENFRDQLTLTEKEKHTRNCKNKTPHSFCNKLEEERESRLHGDHCADELTPIS